MKIRYKYIKLLTFAFLKLIRFPNLCIIILTQYFTRIFLIGPKQQWADHITDIDMFLISLSTIFIASAGYIINDYYDIKIDYINKPKRIVVGRIFKRRTAMGLHVVLSALGVIIGVFLSIKVAVINIFVAFLLWFYSNYLQRIPFIGNFIIALLTALIIEVVAFYFHSNIVNAFSCKLCCTFAIFAFFVSLIREIVKDMADVKGDIAFGCKTLPIIWGIRRTKYLLYGLAAIFIVILFSFIIYFHIFIFAIIVVLMFWFIIKLIRADTKKNYSYLSAICKLIMLGGIIGMSAL